MQSDPAETYTECVNIGGGDTLEKVTVTSGESKGDARDACPPPLGGPNSFNFMQFLKKKWQNRMLAPTWRIGAPTW